MKEISINFWKTIWNPLRIHIYMYYPFLFCFQNYPIFKLLQVNITFLYKSQKSLNILSKFSLKQKSELPESVRNRRKEIRWNVSRDSLLPDQWIFRLHAFRYPEDRQSLPILLQRGRTLGISLQPPRNSRFQPSAENQKVISFCFFIRSNRTVTWTISKLRALLNS